MTQAPRSPLAVAVRRAGLGVLAAAIVILVTIVFGWDQIIEYNGKETEMRMIAKILAGEFALLGCIVFGLLVAVWKARRSGTLHPLHALSLALAGAFVGLAGIVTVSTAVELLFPLLN